MNQPRSWIAAIAIAAMVVAPTVVRADGRNEIRAVTLDEDGATTRVHVAGAQTPTFTVYKLERPNRVVVDVPKSRLGDALRGHDGAAQIAANTWAVSTVAAHQLDDGSQVVRVIITLARPARYDVKLAGSELLVLISAHDPAPPAANPAALAAARQEAARSKADADAARADAAQQRSEAQAAQASAARLQDASARRDAEASQARSEADAARADAAQARREAEAARRDAEAAWAQAAADRRQAEAARASARRMMRDAAQQLATLDDRTRAAQAREDKARAARAAAEAREEAARAQVASAAAERAAAEAEVRRAAEAREDSAHPADALRDQATAGAVAPRLAAARAAIARAEQQRAAAEAAANTARRDLERTRAALAAVEQQRAVAEAATSDAARQRAAAEVAASDAVRRQRQAEIAADAARQQRQAADAARTAAVQRLGEAEQQRAQAEQQRVAAEQAARTARAAADAADRQRAIAESAAQTAGEARRVAEAGVAELEARRAAAERAASELEARSKAEATARAQAQAVAAAQAARQASADESARARAEVNRLADERKRAERELADRRAAVAAQQAETERLRRTASQARDAADREEARRAQLAEQRVAEERALAAIQARRAAVQQAATVGGAQAVSTGAGAPAAMMPGGTQQAAAPGGAQQAMMPGAAPAATAAASSMTAVTRPSSTSTPALTSTSTSTSTPASTSSATPASPRAAHPFGSVADRWAMSRKPSSSAITVRSPGAVLAIAPPAAAGPPATPAAPPAPAAPAAPVAPPAEIRDISFSGDEATGQVAIAVTGDVTVRAGAITATTAELILDHAQLATRLERKLDVSRFRGPVRAVSLFRDRRTPGRVRLIAELASPATPSFDREPGAIRWNLVGAEIARRPVSARAAIAQAAPVGGGFGAASTPIAQQSVAQVPPQAARRRVYHGQPMELHFKDAPIHDLLRLIADVGKVSIVVPDTIDAKVTLDLKRVPWDQALEVILSSHQLWYRREGNLYRIAPRKELDAEDEAEAARREAQLKAEAPRAQLVPLNYASASDLARKLEPMLSPHGKIAVDERTNQLIVTDVSGNRDQITRLAQSLDTQTPQISIEARIVEANSTFARQIGVQWGGRATASPTGGNATGLVFPSSISLIGGNEDSQTPRGGVATPSDFAINLPAATGTGEGGAIGLSLGSVGGNFNINLRLSALEDSGTIRIISAPKVTVLNNKQASIASGVSIPISTVSASGTQTQFVQADLRLDVVPTVSQSDCSITLALSVQKSEPNFAAVGARGDPSITRKEARTSMLVADGETSVLGGIYTRNTGLNYKKVPFFGDLPVLGWLFKFRRENDDRTEILVFITPKITNRALLRCR